ncbi:MAG: hypothetical protein LBV26_07990 [Bacteroidales bacterium]|nr:hypothetical protein [Bacteroidales bacterium]
MQRTYSCCSGNRIMTAQVASPATHKYHHLQPVCCITATLCVASPATHKYHHLQLYDSKGITRPPSRKDITTYRIDATDEAARMNNPQIFNMIVLGRYLKVKPVIKHENTVKGLRASLPERRHNLIPANEQALLRGRDIIAEVPKQAWSHQTSA